MSDAYLQLVVTMASHHSAVSGCHLNSKLCGDQRRGAELAAGILNMGVVLNHRIYGFTNHVAFSMSNKMAIVQF